DAGRAIHLTDDGVEPIDDVEIVRLGNRDGVRFVEGRQHGRAAVAGVAFLAGARDGGDDAGLEIDLANAVIHRFRDVEMPAMIDVTMKRLAHGRFNSKSAVASMPALAGPGKGG